MPKEDNQLEEMRILRRKRIDKLAKVEPDEVELAVCPDCQNNTVVERNAGLYKFCLKCPWKEMKGIDNRE